MVNKEINRLEDKLNERIKELNCLYGFSEIIEEKDLTKEEILKRTVELFPPAWQYPDITCARIIADSQEYKTENFKETKWKQASDIYVYGKKIGTAEVYYLEEKPDFDEGPFLREERKLIKGISERLGNFFERIEAEIKLKESEEWLSTTLRSIGDAVIATDAKGNISFLNPVAESLTGWKQSDAIKRPVLEIFNIINENTREKVENPVEKVMREGVIVGLANHTILISKDGREIPIDDSGAPIKDKDGKITGVVLIFRDITERKKSEEIIRDRAKYDFLLESLSDGVIIIDREWRYLLINDEVARMVQMSKDELIGNKMTELFPGVEDTVFGRAYAQVFESGEPTTAADKFTFPDGRYVWYEVQVFPTPEGLLIIVADITERKLSEKALSIKNRLSEVFLTIPDDNTYNEVLKVILEVMESGYGTFGFIDENGALVIPSMTRDIWEECQVSDKVFIFPRNTWGDNIWTRAIKEMKTLFSNEKSSLTPKGHIEISRNISTPIIDKGKVIGLLQVANKESDYAELDIQLMDMISKQLAPILNARVQRDLEEKKRKNAEAELKKYLESLEDTVKERTKQIQEIQDELVRKERLAVLGQLAGGVGHELRNPLGAIKNATYFLNMVLEEPDPEVKETLEILDKEVNTSERIISSLLGFARPKSLIVRKVEINDIIREVLSRSVIPKNVKLIENLSKSLPIVLADPDQLKQVLENIILNATQAMSNGGQLTIKSESKNQKYLSISINDSGEGISEENLKNIFKPLFTTKAKGIGLGLAICKIIVEKHEGSIEAKSELGKGSTFVIKLPIDGIERK